MDGGGNDSVELEKNTKLLNGMASEIGAFVEHVDTVLVGKDGS